MSFLRRLEPLARSILARGPDRAPMPALTHVLLDPVDDLPGLYKPALKSVLAAPDILRALPGES